MLAAVFDDVLFNAISFFDYLGNFVGYVYRGPQGQKLKWNGVVDSGHDKNNSLSEHSAIREVIAQDKRWVGRLQKVRSDFIHYGAVVGHANMTVNVTDVANATFTVALIFEVPDQILSKLEIFKATPRPVSMADAAAS